MRALLLLALLVASVGWWADRQLHQTINRELRADLSATLEANVTALEIWMTNQKRLAASLADEPRLKAVALKLLDQPTEGEDPQFRVAVAGQPIAQWHVPGYGLTPGEQHLGWIFRAHR